MNTSRTQQTGFTLVEMVTTVAIIGILASVVIANFSDARTQSRIESATSMMESVRTTAALCTFKGSNLNTPAAGSVVCSRDTLTWPALPGGWVYGGSCTFDQDVSDGTFMYCAIGDSVTVTCTQDSCTAT